MNGNETIITMLEELLTLYRNRHDSSGVKSETLDLTPIKSLVDDAMKRQGERIKEELKEEARSRETSMQKIGLLFQQIYQKLESGSEKPTVIQKQHVVRIESRKVIGLFVCLTILISLLSAALYVERKPDYSRMDNDLKYRYIRMKGEVSPENISELETVFGMNCDNEKIHQMRKDVTEYEHAVQVRAEFIEQARLREQEARELERKATNIKTRK